MSSTPSATTPTASSPISTRSTTSTSPGTRSRSSSRRSTTATRAADAARDRAAPRGAPTELWRFACEGYLGGLTRSHQEKARDRSRPSSRRPRRRDDPYRMLRVAIANEPDRDRRERLERARLELLDEQLNPLYLEAAADRPRRRSPSSARQLLRALQALRLRARRARRAVPARCSTRPSRCGSRPATGSSASGSGIGLARRASRRRRAALPRARARTRPTRPIGCSPRSRRRSPTSASTSRVAEQHPPRPRAAARQEPAAVLLPDRGSRQGDARDPADRRPRRLGGALPRGRPRRALREHLGVAPDGGEAARRHGGHRGLGDAACSISSTSPPG